MISNITNALPAMLKRLRDNDQSIKLNFDLVEMLNFYSSILPRQKTSHALKHIFLDCTFKLKEEYRELISSLSITLDTFPFLKDLDYILNEDDCNIVIRASMEDLSIFSLIMLGSIKNLPEETHNKSIFISLAMNYLKFCLMSGYNACTTDDVEILERYNDGFDKEMFESISFKPSNELDIGTIHFIGIELNKDILCIFEKYNMIKFTFNEETASFIISMRGKDWNDFWKNAPQYLKNEFKGEDGQKVDVM